MSVFNSLYAGQYDQLYLDKNYQGECDLIESAIKRFASSRPNSILDVGCGTGSHALELAKRGYRVTGVDLSQAMLDQASEKAQLLDSTQRPTWRCGDARHFDAGGTFDTAIMMFAVIGYLTTNDDVVRGLQNIRRHLNPGALFVCDFWYGPTVLSVRPTDRVRVLPTPQGQVIRAASTTLDIIHHTADVTFNLWALQGDRLIGETNEKHHLRYFFPQEFELMLRLGGFSPRSLSAFPSLDVPLSGDTWNALVVAESV